MPTRCLRKETRKLTDPFVAQPLDESIGDKAGKVCSNVHILVTESVGRRDDQIDYSNESSEAELSLDEITLGWESDMVRSYESIQLSSNIPDSKASPPISSECYGLEKRIQEPGLYAEDITDLPDFSNEGAGKKLQWKTQTQLSWTDSAHQGHSNGSPMGSTDQTLGELETGARNEKTVQTCQLASTYVNLAEVEHRIEIAANDARFHLAECHTLLAEVDALIAQKEPISDTLSLETESTGYSMDDISDVYYLRGFNFSAHRELLEVQDESVLKVSTSSGELKCSETTDSNLSEISNDSGRRIPEPTTYQLSSTSTQSYSENAVPISQMDEVSSSIHRDLLEDVPDETMSSRSASGDIHNLSATTTLNNSTTSIDSGVDRQGIGTVESPTHSRISSSSNKLHATTGGNRSDALNNLFEDLNITSVNGDTSLPQSKIRGLVHVFEERGLMPDLPTRSLSHLGSKNRVQAPELPHESYRVFKPKSSSDTRSNVVQDCSVRMSSFATDEDMGFGSSLKRCRRASFEGMGE